LVQGLQYSHIAVGSRRLTGFSGATVAGCSWHASSRRTGTTHNIWSAAASLTPGRQQEIRRFPP